MQKSNHIKQSKSYSLPVDIRLNLQTSGSLLEVVVVNLNGLLAASLMATPSPSISESSITVESPLAALRRLFVFRLATYNSIGTIRYVLIFALLVKQLFTLEPQTNR